MQTSAEALHELFRVLPGNHVKAESPSSSETPNPALRPALWRMLAEGPNLYRKLEAKGQRRGTYELLTLAAVLAKHPNKRWELAISLVKAYPESAIGLTLLAIADAVRNPKARNIPGVILKATIPRLLSKSPSKAFSHSLPRDLGGMFALFAMPERPRILGGAPRTGDHEGTTGTP